MQVHYENFLLVHVIYTYENDHVYDSHDLITSNGIKNLSSPSSTRKVHEMVFLQHTWRAQNKSESKI